MSGPHCRPLPPVTLVLGGARSGKSAFAEEMIEAHRAHARSDEAIYLATAEPRDAEMRARIEAHQARRGSGWRTLEVPVGLTQSLASEDDGPMLVDCLTLWLTNLLLDARTLEEEIADLVDALAARGPNHSPLVLVSNEVGLGIIPDNALARSFRDAAGHMHQQVADVAQQVVFTAAGLPMVLKRPADP